jgi:hypothetical protein
LCFLVDVGNKKVHFGLFSSVESLLVGSGTVGGTGGGTGVVVGGSAVDHGFGVDAGAGDAVEGVAVGGDDGAVKAVDGGEAVDGGLAGLGNQDFGDEAFFLVLEFGEGQTLDGLFAVQFGEATLLQASELDLHGGKLTGLGAALGAALEDGDAGEAKFVAAFQDLVLLTGALTGHGDEALVNFSGEFGVLGALTGFGDEAFLNGGFEGLALGRRDSVGGDFDFGSGVDALSGATEVGHSLVVEVTAETAQLVLQHLAGLNRDTFTVELDEQVVFGSLEVKDTIDRSGDFANEFSSFFFADGLLGVLVDGDFGTVDGDSDVTRVSGERGGGSEDNFGSVQEDLDFLGQTVGVDGSGEDTEAEGGGAVAAEQMEAVVEFSGDGSVVEGTEPALFNFASGVEGASSNSFQTTENVAFTAEGKGQENRDGVRDTDILEFNGFFGLVDVKVKDIDGLVEDKADIDLTVFTEVFNNGSGGVGSLLSKVGPEESLKTFSDLFIDESDVGRSVDVFDLEVNFINGLGQDSGFFAGSGRMGTRNLEFDKTLAFTGNGGFTAHSLLLFGNLGGTNNSDLGFFASLTETNGVLVFEVHVSVADHVNVPRGDSGNVGIAVDTNLTVHGGGSGLGFKSQVPLLLHGHIIADTSAHFVSVGGRTGTLEDSGELEDESHTRLKLKLFGDLLKDFLSDRVDLFRDGSGENGVGVELAEDGSFALELFQRLDINVVVQRFFTGLLGHATNLEGHFDFLGLGSDGIVLELVGVSAESEAARFGNAGKSDESDHVDGVEVVALESLVDIGQVKVASFSFNDALEVQAQGRTEGNFHLFKGLDGVNNLHVSGGDLGKEAVVRVVDSVRADLRAENVNRLGAAGDGSDLNLKLGAFRFEGNVGLGRNVKEDIVGDTGGDHVLGEGAVSTNATVDGVEGRDLGVHGDGRNTSFAFDMHLTADGDGSGHVSFDDDGETHFRGNQDFGRSNVHHALEGNGSGTTDLGHDVSGVLQERSNLFVDQLVGDIGNTDKVFDIIEQVQVGKGGQRTVFSGLDLELVNNLGPFLVKLSLDLTEGLFVLFFQESHLLHAFFTSLLRSVVFFFREAARFSGVTSTATVTVVTTMEVFVGSVFTRQFLFSFFFRSKGSHELRELLVDVFDAVHLEGNFQGREVVLTEHVFNLVVNITGDERVVVVDPGDQALVASLGSGHVFRAVNGARGGKGTGDLSQQRKDDLGLLDEAGVDSGGSFQSDNFLLLGKGVDSGVDSVKNFDVLFTPGGGSNLLHVDHGRVELDHGGESSDSDFGVFSRVVEDGEDNGEDEFRVSGTSVTQSVDRQEAGDVSVAVFRSGSVFRAEGNRAFDEGQKNGDNVLVAEGAKSNDEHVSLVNVGGVLEFSGQVRDQLFDNNFRLRVAEFAKDGGGVVDVSGFIEADLLDKVGQTEDSGVVKDTVLVNRFSLDKFEERFEDFGGRSDDVVGQERNNTDGLDLGHFLALDHFLKEGNSGGGTSQNDRVKVDVLEHAQLFFRSGESLLEFGVNGLHFFFLEESESTDDGHDLHGDFLFGDVFNFGKVMHDLFNDFLDFSHDLFRGQSLLGFLGRRSGEVVSGEVSVDVSILEFRLGDLGDQANLATEKRLTGAGVVFVGNRFDDAGLAGFGKSVGDGFDLLEKEDLTGTSDDIFSVFTEDLLGKFTFVDNGLEDGVGAGTASVVSGD